MNLSVITRRETHDPFIYCELEDGRLTQLQFDRVADHDHERFLPALQSALSSALAAHADELMAQIMVQFAPPPDPQREREMAFVAEMLAAAKDAEPLPQRNWFPDQADGRDASGQVHISVARFQVVILEVPVGMLANAQRCGWAIREAFNQALERREGDLAEYLEIAQRDRPSTDPEIGTRLV